MSQSSFAAPAALPCFINDARTSLDVWANGCRYIRSFYDGQRNLVEIVPLVSSPGTIGCICAIEVGQSYTISQWDLTRRIVAGLNTNP